MERGRGVRERRTPHLALLLDVRVLHAENRSPLHLVDVNLDKLRHVVLDLAYTPSATALLPNRPCPNCQLSTTPQTQTQATKTQHPNPIPGTRRQKRKGKGRKHTKRPRNSNSPQPLLNIRRQIPLRPPLPNLHLNPRRHRNRRPPKLRPPPRRPSEPPPRTHPRRRPRAAAKRPPRRRPAGQED